VAPIVNGLSKRYAGQLRVTRVNVLLDSSQALMERFSFSSTPEIYLLDESGKILARWDEGVTAEVVAQAIENALEKR